MLGKNPLHKFLDHFIVLFEETNVAKTDFIFSIEIFISYFFNKTIAIIINANTMEELINAVIKISSKFEESVIFIFKTKTFLSGNYLKQYEKYYLIDYSNLLGKEFLDKYSFLQ